MSSSKFLYVYFVRRASQYICIDTYFYILDISRWKLTTIIRGNVALFSWQHLKFRFKCKMRWSFRLLFTFLNFTMLLWRRVNVNFHLQFLRTVKWNFKRRVGIFCKDLLVCVATRRTFTSNRHFVIVNQEEFYIVSI